MSIQSIDSRDVIARIEELEDEEQLDAELTEELHNLKKLAEQGEQYAADWRYGETLINDSYFEDYAQELAEDCGTVDAKAKWPNNCIDWSAAAELLKQDYTAIDFNGETFWVRS
jgi:hypothetical protein